MKTHGERWLEKAHKRIEGYCKTRNLKCGPSVQIHPGYGTRTKQYEVWMADREGRESCIAYRMSGDCPVLLDAYGRGVDLSAVSFDEALESSGLQIGRLKPNRKQMELF